MSRDTGGGFPTHPLPEEPAITTTTAPPAVPPLAVDVPRTLADDEPLTMAWVNKAIGHLCSLGLPRIADWLMEPGRGDRLEWPEVEELIRDVLDVTGEEMGYRYVDGEALPRDMARRDATRTELLLLWATPRYTDDDE